MDSKIKYAICYVLLWAALFLLHTVAMALLMSGKPEWYRLLAYLENGIFMAVINDKLTNTLLKTLLALKKPK